MAFSRSKYDECQYKLQLKRSTKPGSYQFFAPKHENCDRCYSYHGPKNSQGDVAMARKDCMLDLGVKADVESHLTDRVVPLNNCNDKGKNQGYLAFQNKMQSAQRCQRNVRSVESRFTNPLDAYRGMYTFEYGLNPHLHVNPQCQIQDADWRNGMTSRLIARDTYKVKKPKLLDQGEAFPNGGKIDPLPDMDPSLCATCKK